MWMVILFIGTCFVPPWCFAAEDTSVATSSQCVLPPYPDNGIYEVLNVPDARPGQSYPSAVLTMKCRRGYGLVDKLGHRAEKQIYCINGDWYQDMVECVRFCKLDPHPSVSYVCEYPGQGIQPCESYVPPGTGVEPECNSPTYYSTDVLLRMWCFGGYFNYIARCKAECGRITPVGQELIIDGTQAMRGEMPWHVGVYRTTGAPFKQICGGSIVSENVVISAAHCFWTDASKLLPAHDFAVAAGKIHRNWFSKEDGSEQKSFVKKIKISKLYAGVAANFQDDIAVLILKTPFKFTTYIQPVCLNFQPIFDNIQLQHGNLGKVAGWGLTAANGDVSPVLNVLEIPFISIDVCIATLPASFRAYITGDKFCAGYTNGKALCRGDSGGGLAFKAMELAIDRYYLRGVLSTAPTDEEKLCNDHTYSTFTKISEHEQLIKHALAASGPVCPLYSFQCDDGSCANPGSDCNGKQDCADGSDEFSEYCLFSNFTSTPQSYSECGVFDGRENGTLPWTAYIRVPADSNILYHIGVLISNTHVIYSDWEFIHPDQYLVGFGEYNFSTSEFAVERHVIRLTKSKKHGGIDEGFITILKLDQRIEYSLHIRPACLWDDEIPQGLVTPTMFLVWNRNITNTPVPMIFPYNVSLLNDSSHDLVIPDINKTNFKNVNAYLYFLYNNKWRLSGMIFRPAYFFVEEITRIQYVKLAPEHLSEIRNVLNVE